MIERYQGSDGRRLLVEALRAQPFVEGQADVAAELAEVAFLEEVPAGHHIMEQDGEDNDIVLIVSGFTEKFISTKERLPSGEPANTWAKWR